MFGYHKAKKAKKKAKQQKHDLEKERKAFEKEKKYYGKENQNQLESRAEELANKAKSERQNALAEGRKYGEEFIARDVPGLTQAERSAMQSQANNMINSQYYNDERKLLGEQGRNNIIGKSGIAYAQRQDLMQKANDQRAAAQRDVMQKNAEQQNRNRAALAGFEQGEAAQSQLDKQSARDKLELENEKKRQRALEDKFSRQFMRL